MDLWIRSQNKKKLIKTNRIYQFASIVYTEAEETIELGTYKSKERALEVLDEIQNAILCSSTSPEELKELKIEFKSWYATNIKTGVAIYQMPEE